MMMMMWPRPAVAIAATWNLLLVVAVVAVVLVVWELWPPPQLFRGLVSWVRHAPTVVVWLGPCVSNWPGLHPWMMLLIQRMKRLYCSARMVAVVMVVVVWPERDVYLFGWVE